MALETRSLRRITGYVMGFSVAITLLTFGLSGAWMGFGAAVGGALGTANWMGMRWIGARILAAHDKGRVVWSTLLALKMTAILGVVVAVLATGVVDTFGFALGMSGLVVGVLAGGFHLAYHGELAGEES